MSQIEVLYLTKGLSKKGAKVFLKSWMQNHDKPPLAVSWAYPNGENSTRQRIVFVEKVPKNRIELRRTYRKDESELKEIVI